MGDLGKMLIVVGAVMLIAGVVLVFAARSGVPLGRLPGDIVVRGKHTTFYFPLVTCIVLSVVLSVILWVLGRLGR